MKFDLIGPVVSEEKIFENVDILHTYIRTYIRTTEAYLDNLWYKLIKLGIRGKILNIIMSMYQNVKSIVKFNNEKSKDFVCHTGVRQVEWLSPFLFSMFINDLEEELILKNIEGLDFDYFKLFLLMYADDIVLFSETADGLQNGLNCMNQYCQKWKGTVNIQKTKVMVFRKGGTLRRNTRFYYGEHEIEIVNKFAYLGIVFFHWRCLQ